MSRAESPRCAPGQLWVPGLSLDNDFPVPGDDELCSLWREYDPVADDVLPLKDVYGVYRKPDNEPLAVASIDLCEVVRDTAVSVRSFLGQEGRRCGVYAPEGSWYNTPELENSVVTSIAQILMNNAMVQPVPEIAEIATIIKSWRQVGIYCAANTSTLPGCEPGTIKHTLGKDLPGAFDALVLPRNHDGRGSMTKARALGVLCLEAKINIEEIPLVHIDDMVHHISGFEQHYGSHSQSRYFVPVHEDNGHAANHHKHHSPLGAFLAADNYFRELGVIV